MNIKILDSWLREFLKTKATPKEIAEKLSLTSVSIERIEPYNNDFVYDIEITTNRPDLASVTGLAREAAAVLPQAGIPATFDPPQLPDPKIEGNTPITIENDPKLVNRVCAVVMEVIVKESPKELQEKLETSDIRSLNNLIDITNLVMRTIGHPSHVFDYDRLGGTKLIIRETKKGEEIITLDDKKHTLSGGDIVAVNEQGEIIDLLGVMGLKNSVVTNETRRILFFLDNNDPKRMRKTSMGLAIRSEAAQINEKGIDPELAMDALLYGISLYEKYADGKVISKIIDIYPNKPQDKTVTISLQKINSIIGVEIPAAKVTKILTTLGFSVVEKQDVFLVTVPSFRLSDIEIAEDIIEEIARVNGYHTLPSILPQITSPLIKRHGSDIFFWEKKVKDALKFWGFTESYTYSMVSEDMYEGPITDAVAIKNPLSEDHMYMRNSLVPSLLQVIKENSGYKTLSLFEIANIYEKNGAHLPKEILTLAAVMKKPGISFFEAKGVIEQLLIDLGIKIFSFKKAEKGGVGADIFIGKEKMGEIEVLEENLVNFEMNFEKLASCATLTKTYTPLSKYPPIIEDISLVVDEKVSTGNIILEIQKQSPLIFSVTLLDMYKDTRTFHIVYQDNTKNLTNEEVGKVREEVLQHLQKKFEAKIK